jgi:drug/metabolite transporter (DMT)-like permease
LLVIGGSIGRGQVLGDLLALSVALCGSVAIVTTRHARSFDLIPATLISGVVAIGAALPFAEPLAPSARDMFWMAVLGLVQATIGLSLFLMALRRLPVVEVTLIALLEPVLGPIWVWLFVDEVPPLTTLIGGAIVIAALVINTVWSARRPRGAS